MHRLTYATTILLCALPSLAIAQTARPVLLKPARVFDGVGPKPHDGWVVLVGGERIVSAGPEGQVKVPDELA